MRGSRWKVVASALGGLAQTLGAAQAAAELTGLERRWLEATVPVLAYARAQQLPLDILVQPQPTPGEPPLGMAVVDGRCKLVVSMRGNPQAQATLDSIPPTLLGPVVEAIAAHELAHCWRHLSQRWGQLPAELPAPALSPRLSAAHATLLTEMWRTRREEAYADLVGLAWTLQHHPAHYAAVHAWHLQLRADPPVATGPHDTLAWLQLAGDTSRFTPGASVFEQAEPLWRAGLRTLP